jgi:maltose/moltooligosaccharide transporter
MAHQETKIADANAKESSLLDIFDDFRKCLPPCGN